MTEVSTDVQARRDLAAAHRLAVLEGFHEGTWNHFSLKRPERPEQILLTPGHIHFSQVCASNLVVMDAKGEMVSGELEPNTAAWALHYPVQRARPDLACLMHVHTPYATALSMRLDLAFNDRSSQAAAHFYGAVATYNGFDGAPGEDEGARLAEALADKRALLLRNHGCLVGGETVAHCWHSLYLFERACMFQMLAAADDNSLSLIAESEAAAVADYAHSSVWELRFRNWCRLLEAEHGDYRD